MNRFNMTIHQPAAWLPAALAGAAMLAGAASARADEALPPSGYITVMRSVPAHNPFRPADSGQPTNIATARADLTVGATRAIIPEIHSITDDALGEIGAPRQDAGGTAGGAAALANAAMPRAGRPGAMDGGVARTVQGGIGGTVTRAMAPLSSALGAAFAILPGVK